MAAKVVLAGKGKRMADTTGDDPSRAKRIGTWLVSPYSGSRLTRLGKWLLFPGLLVALIIYLGVWVWDDDADAAAPPPTQHSKCLVPKAAATTTEANICPGYVKERVRKFRKGKLGNAKGLHLPKFFQKRILNKYGKTTKDIDWGWITEPLKATSCLVTNPTGTHRGTCDEGQKNLNRKLRKVNKIVAVCGSAGVAGSVRGGGSIGAGLTSGFCFWNFYLEFVY